MPLTREFKETVQARSSQTGDTGRNFCGKASSACWLEISIPERRSFATISTRQSGSTS